MNQWVRVILQGYVETVVREEERGERKATIEMRLAKSVRADE